jgi:hypothetical protein
MPSSLIIGSTNVETPYDWPGPEKKTARQEIVRIIVAQPGLRSRFLLGTLSLSSLPQSDTVHIVHAICRMSSLVGTLVSTLAASPFAALV